MYMQLRAIWIRQSRKDPGPGSREKVTASTVKILAWVDKAGMLVRPRLR